MVKLFLLFAAINGTLAVMLGAFGAHGLKGKISEPLLTAFQTSTHYQMFHVLALMGLALILMRMSEVPIALQVAGYLWMLGIVLFSGSLYGLALGGPGWLGPITPLGGSLLIVGWICFSVGVFKLSL
ncbi:hypothetical protein AB835_13675 [Candidatus Endobugula sertula]|uniref:DUF423 domain-containing protein n=1 Tax=Candidatus Endobugula sertula TaxID=62101 RepID=A0A1D2QLS3_9GAMM|nr:hypothetical protein AB835_13675 [Candidatus Endobugula sertula]